MTALAPEKVDWRKVEPSQEAADELFPPQDIGPVWQKDTFGQWLLPEYTLGYDVIAWAEEWLSSPMGDGTRLIITPEQMRIILWHYAVDENGNWSYWQTLWQSAKGSGKDGLGAILAVVELIGPCRFSHWEKDPTDPSKKMAIARDNPSAWVQFVGVSKAQTRNTMDFVPLLLSERTRIAYNLEVQKEIVYASGTGRKLEQIGSNYGSLEGNRVTYAVLNETQHWLPSQGGNELFETVSNNVLKMRGHFLMITNAYQPGEGSKLEDIRNEQEKVWAGLKAPSGWLYMSREANAEAPLHPDWVAYILFRIYGDATWQTRNLTQIAQKVLDGSTPPSRIRRMFYNQVVASEDAFFSPAEVVGSRRAGARGDDKDLEHGDEIVLGFDGGKTDDATALVAIRIKDKLIVPLMVLQKPEGPLGEGWRVTEELVNEYVMMAFQEYKVRGFYADPALWQSWISRWNEDYREQLGIRASTHSSIAWEMTSSNQKIGRAWESFYDAIRTQRLQHNGDKVLEQHMRNAHRGRGRGGLIARKENPDSPRKIDAMVAGYIAYAALEDYLQRGAKPTQYRRQMLRG